jgi:ubiquinone/menaquinone biosynthesis C-methylase UbiE
MQRMTALKRQEEHFDDVAHEYDESLPGHVVEHLLQRRVEFVRSYKESGRVLDVGCGTGTFLERLGEGPFECVGVDVSDAMVERANARGVDARKAAADELPFVDGSFDVVTCIAVLHHLIDPALVHRAILEMARVLRPGGVAIVWDHNPWNPYWPLLMRHLPQDQGDEKLVAARRIVGSFRAAGLDNVTVRRLTFVPDFVPPGVLKYAARIERVLEKTPGLRLIAAHNVITGRRPGR